MSSAFVYGERIVWGSNGAIEEILKLLIRYAPDNSTLLGWALEHYREFFSGCCCHLEAVLTGPELIAQWQVIMARILDELRLEGGWTELGIAWIDAERENLIHIADAGTLAPDAQAVVYPPPGGVRVRNPWLATYASHWLEDELLPLALNAAGLPADSPLDDLALLEQPPQRHADAEARAWSFCCELALLGAVAIADELAANEHSRKLRKVITGLVWRDALDCVHARDLAFDTNLPGIDNSDFEAAHQAAQAVWARWQATEASLSAKTMHFLSLCADVVYDEGSDGG